MATKKLDKILKDRGEQYGDFRYQFAFSQEIKDLMKEQPNWEELTPAQKEVLEMVSHKLSRILYGNPNNEDSWRDIAGYVTLVADEVSV